MKRRGFYQRILDQRNRVKSDEMPSYNDPYILRVGTDRDKIHEWDIVSAEYLGAEVDFIQPGTVYINNEAVYYITEVDGGVRLESNTGMLIYKNGALQRRPYGSGFQYVPSEDTFIIDITPDGTVLRCPVAGNVNVFGEKYVYFQRIHSSASSTNISTLAALSAGAKQSVYSIYSLRRVWPEYTGAILRLRSGVDIYDFMDGFGEDVVMLYDQSGNNRHLAIDNNAPAGDADAYYPPCYSPGLDMKECHFEIPFVARDFTVAIFDSNANGYSRTSPLISDSTGNLAVYKTPQRIRLDLRTATVDVGLVGYPSTSIIASRQGRTLNLDVDALAATSLLKRRERNLKLNNVLRIGKHDADDGLTIQFLAIFNSSLSKGDRLILHRLKV